MNFAGSSKNLKTSSFSLTVNDISNSAVPLHVESSCSNNSDLSSNIPNNTRLEEPSKNENKSVEIHSATTTSQVL